MSTFGEIVEPSSRATWEDWDDVGSNNHSPALGWQKQLQMPEEVDKFFLFEGKYLWNGMRAKENTQEVNCIKEANLHLYKTPETNNYEKPLSEYQTTQTLMSSHIIRKLTTTNTSNLMNVDYLPKLEQPNFITGVSAGVFSLREHLNLSAAALVIYMEQSQDYQLQVIDNLLQNLNISEIPQMKPNEVSTSNLYI